MKASGGEATGHWREWLLFVALNFATPVAFFVTFKLAGAKPAIALAIGITACQILAHWLTERPFTPFFLVSSGFTILFGSMDLIVTSPRFFRLAPFAENLILGTIFLATVFTRRPIVAWFAESLPEFVRPNLGETGRAYLKKVTAAWGLYFIAKSFVFLYVALRVDLGVLIIFRAVFGTASFVVMFAGEWLYRKYMKG